MRPPEPEELATRSLNSEATWDSCRVTARGDVLSTSFNGGGRDGSPDFLFWFTWDRDAGDVRVRVTAPGCSGCRWGHSFREDEVFWTACPPPPWREACERICEAWRLAQVADVLGR